MLALSHIILLALSNVLVQYPFVFLGQHTTYGAFSYPFIFILSDLTTRKYGKQHARKIIMQAMFPALLISYLMSSYQLRQAHFSDPEILALRVALASFIAYVLGQLLDITIFSSLRKNKRWYAAPLASSTIGNLFDTFCFFFIAFYAGSHPFMATHWLDVAMVDLVFKFSISMLAFIPIYGLCIKRMSMMT